jgi:hypothetical protein
MPSDMLAAMGSSHGVLALVLILIAVVLWRSGLFGRVLRIVEEMMLSNWQLALLGAAALALSIASGYTTFDGLRNFTSAPLLSALIAFGIQGVLLIVAWLIGETFATGMSQRTPREVRSLNAREAVIGMGLGAALAGLAFYWVLSRSGAIGTADSAGGAARLHADWQRVADVTVWFLIGLVLLALIAFGARRGGDIAHTYVQSVRLIVKNGVLWIMLFACMGASVFFSFDSHFNAIFPAGQRQRAAEIRTLNQVGGIIADIGARARKVQTAEAERLFETDAWKTYDAGLASLALTARDAQAEIEAFLAGRMEERQRGIGEQQERIAGAERSRSALLRKRDELEAELARIEPGIGALEADFARAQAAYNETRQAIAAKRIDASAEDGGVEGSLKPGKGPIYRQRVAELEELQRKLAITDEPRFKQAQRQHDQASARIVSLKREIATIGAEVAKYKGEIAAAEQRIKASEMQEGSAPGGSVAPARALPDFERARTAFRQQPDATRLAALQARCNSLLEALAGAPAARENVRGLDCDPKEVTEAAAQLFALNAGRLVFREGCAGGSRLPQAASTDELLAFGRKCLQDSGLVSRDTADLSARLQAIEMNRDDKAHPFVVTINAVLDGNRLAYMALVLAVGVDSLIFMAGLFGAVAVRSPLSDLPSPRVRSAEQLEAVVRNALGRNRAGTADLVLAAMRPAPGDDHRSEVDVASCAAGERDRIRKVLVAGRSIGAVERTSSQQGELYLVRPELIEFLAQIAGASLGADGRPSGRTRRAATKAPDRLPRQRSSVPSTPPEIEAEVEPVPLSSPPTLPKSADAGSPALITDARSMRERNEEALRQELRHTLRQELATKVKAVVAGLARGSYRNPRDALKRIARDSAFALQGAGLGRRYGTDEHAVGLLDEVRRDIGSEFPSLLRSVLDGLVEEAEQSGQDGLPSLLRQLRDEIAAMDFG